MPSPMLDPPCPGWKRDLPGPTDPPKALGGPEQPPNYLDGIYLELSRRSSSVRGTFVVTVPLCAYAFIWQLTIAIRYDWFSSGDMTDRLIALFVIALCSAGYFYLAAFLYHIDVSTPRDLPIRFNRVRRRIYVYGFHQVWWNPFGGRYATTASHDWNDVRAEVWEQWGPTAGGGLIIKWGVSIAIVKPGTNEVLERFHLSTYNKDLDNLWAYVCTYMQQGPQALPPCDIEPRDANDVPAYNLALRWAPLVEWPEAMDIESRSAP